MMSTMTTPTTDTADDDAAEDRSIVLGSRARRDVRLEGLRPHVEQLEQN
jgi:hypothetical protein